MLTLYENYKSDVIDDEEWAWDGYWIGQTFTPTITHQILEVRLYITRFGTPGPLTVSIRATASNLPTGEDLCSGTIDGNALSTSFAWVTIGFGAGTLLQAGTKYAIAVRSPSSDGSTFVAWAEVDAGSYTGGSYVYSVGGSTWTAAAARDCWFEEWGIQISVTRPREIYLYGHYFPTLGEVQKSTSAQWPDKEVIGDFTKDSLQNISSLVSSDHRGGIGIKEMDETKDTDRCDFSTCDLETKGHLLLPTLATDTGNPAAGSTDCATLMEYSNTMYATCGTSVRSWTEATAVWSASLRTLGAAPTDVIVHKSKLYYACGTDFERFTGAVWATGTTLAGSAQSSLFFLEWDGKLFRLTTTGGLFYSIDEGVTWVASAVSNLPAGSFKSLFLMYNSAKSLIIHLGTTNGVFALDFDTAVWIETGRMFPEHPYGAAGACMWSRDSVGYISVGNSVLRYVPGDTAEITPVGPDRDYGLPSTYKGNIVKLIPEHNALYGLISAASASDYSLLLKYNGVGWSVVKTGVTVGKAMTTAFVGTPDGIYRLWFAADAKVFYIPLNVNLNNPLEISTHPYASTATHTWPWFDAANAVADKIAFKVSANVTGTSATEYIQLYYALDNSTTWTLLTNTDFSDGKIDVNGETSFTFAGGEGRSFKSIRFQAVLTRGSTTTVSPDLRWLRLDYLKVPPTQNLYSVAVDCTKDYKRQRAGTLVAALESAADSKTLNHFSYRSYQRTPETKLVRVLAANGPERGGRLKQGQYQVTLLEP